ncbi:uncharacterized protein PpBr36_05927 [Pyricularia pennisetigena]|uniref:uncharacterized protein n=1 Tax=Pyricularia pennisetigena TaxID=1578925 RepID=UPI00114DA873|nr:uncharacterized protein PpBr36_05927 [Pyricularia pennisetigena]TLS22661.1 hypothetical protein PpBr36_05927 [Pyricularia pennisetigena]
MNYRRSHPAAGPDFYARNGEIEHDSRLQDGFIKMLLVLPACLPDARDRNNIEKKTELIQNSNLKAKLYMPESEEVPAFISMGASSKLFMQQGITTAVEYFGRSHEGLAMIEGPLLLVQIPDVGREKFLVQEYLLKVDGHRRMEITALPPKQTEVWRYCLESISFDTATEETAIEEEEEDLIDLSDNVPETRHNKPVDKTTRPGPEPEPKSNPENARSEVQQREFETYVANFKDDFETAVARLMSEPDEMHMRVNFGALLHFQISTNLKKGSLRDYERMLATVMGKGNFHFSKDISYLSGDALGFARKVRLAIEASPEIFAPASNRIDSLEDVPLETTVVVFTPSLRFDMKLQGFTGRENSSKESLGLVRPSIFKRELRNREKYIVSANPGGAFDWDLEVLIRESQDNLDDRLRQLDRFMTVKTELDGTYCPFFEDKLVQNALGVTIISTKSARTYEMGLYKVELAVYIDWDPQSGKRLWQSCAMSLYSVDWNEVLDRRNLAFGPRDFGVCNSALLPVGPSDQLEDGAAILLETIEKVQKFLMDLVCEPKVVVETEQMTDTEPHGVEPATADEGRPAKIITRQVQTANNKAPKSLRLINAELETKAETKVRKSHGKKKSSRR